MHDLVSDIAIPTLWRMADRLPVIDDRSQNYQLCSVVLLKVKVLTFAFCLLFRELQLDALMSYQLSLLIKRVHFQIPDI